TGEKIFAVERLYGIDAKTGKHVAGFGDKDRDGYLFAPRHLKTGEPFTYWHINYDGPAHMVFAGEENLFGLPVYRYETRYEGVKIDQTKNLGYLPGVGVTRGVELEPYLQLWIEPVSGHLVKYKDDTVAYYYDLKTGQRQNPWNHFSNTYTTESVKEQVELAQEEKFIITVTDYVVPGALALLAVIIILFGFRKTKTGKFLLIVVLVGTVLVSLWMWLAPEFVSLVSYTGPVEEVTVGFPLAGVELNTLIFVAEDNGYFKDQGLEVSIKDEPSTIEGRKDLIDGKVDLAGATDYSFAANGLDLNNVKIVASIDRGEYMSIVARKDNGVTIPSDLRGKKIGVVPKTISEYALYFFLINNKIPLEDVRIIHIAPSELVSSLTSGDIDAFSGGLALSYEASKLLGGHAISWSIQEDYPFYWLIAAKQNTLIKHPYVIERFLRALLSAESFVKINQQQAQAIMRKRYSNIDQGYFDFVWPRHNFTISLDQLLVLILERERRWINMSVSSEIVMPNFLNAIYFNALEKVKPEAISIIH
ncbi:MAG: ABC transporter substrate-binding protein, partial [Candidatus Vogelbacteria bacterium]|nr:ABC transporter substrate-binding protein [Candidatus Vogelbacteria bacterium]